MTTTAKANRELELAMSALQRSTRRKGMPVASQSERESAKQHVSKARELAKSMEDDTVAAKILGKVLQLELALMGGTK